MPPSMSVALLQDLDHVAHMIKVRLATTFALMKFEILNFVHSCHMDGPHDQGEVGDCFQAVTLQVPVSAVLTHSWPTCIWFLACKQAGMHACGSHETYM